MSDSDSDSDDQGPEIRLKETLRDTEKKFKLEINKLNEELEEKEEEIEDLKLKLKKQIRKNKKVNSDNETSMESVDVELRKIKEELNSVKEELILKEEIISEKEAAIITVHNHAENLSGEILNLNDQQKKTLNDLKLKDMEIEKLREDIENKIIETKNLEQKNKELINNLKYIKENSISPSESDIESKFKDINQKYTKKLKLKDEELQDLTKELESAKSKKSKNKKNNLSRSSLDRPFIQEPESNNKSILDKINMRTGKEFDSLDACISFITNLSNDTRRWNDVQEEKVVRPASGDKVRQLELENEELHDKIYDIESKCKSIEKKYNKQLKSKNEEIEELQEELESAKAKKPRDNKDKMQIKELKEKIEELEGDIESKTEIIKSKDEKIKTIEIKRNNFETRVKELENEINKFKKDKIELTETIDILNEETDKIVKAKDEEIKKKQLAIEVMKGKIETKVSETVELNKTIAQHAGDLEECRSALKTEKEKYGNLNGISMDRQRKIEANEEKIKSLENEIHNMKVARFQNTDITMGNINPREGYAEKIKWYPGWWDTHTDPDHNNYQQEKKQKQFTTRIPQKPDNGLQVDLMLVACPNCQTMYSPGEIEHHVNECIAN